MAERTVTVRVKAIVSHYQAEMAKASAATQGLIAKAGGIEAIGGKMQSVGGSMTRNLTLPLALAGAAAAKTSLDFERTFSRMVGLAGVAANEVDGLKESVMGLAGETGKAPQELAEALYFIRSSGLAGQEALDALEYSAKAAAAGLGSTVVVADAVTSAINAYGAANLTAAEATDVLAATAEQGKAEASALAGQFGRLLPVSSELGITFGEVGGAMAQLSKSSGSAELSATQLSGVMAKMLSPGMKGAAALDAVGLSAKDLRASLSSEAGLAGTLEMMRVKLVSAGMEFSDFSDDQQFIQGALGLTGDKFEEAMATIAAVEGSVGKTDEAFAEFAHTAGFKNAQAFAKLQVALIQIGDVIVPLLAMVADLGSVFLDAFSALPGPLQMVVVGMLGVLAATGPVLSMGGALVTNFKAIRSAALMTAGTLKTFAGLNGLAAVAGSAMLVAAPVIAAATAFRAFSREADEARDAGSNLAARIRGDFNPAKATVAEFGAEINRLNRESDEMRKRANNAVNPFQVQGFRQAQQDLAGTRDSMKTTWDMAQSLKTELGLTDEAALKLAQSQPALAGEFETASGAIDTQAAAAAVAAQATSDLEDAIKAYGDTLRAQFDPFFAAIDAFNDLASAQSASAEAQNAYNETLKRYGANHPKTLAAAQALASANRDQVTAALDVKDATNELIERMRAGNITYAKTREELQAMVDKGLITEEQFREVAGQLEDVATKAGLLDGRVIPMSITLESLQAERAIAKWTRSTTGGKTRVSDGGGGGAPIRKDGGPIPGHAGQAVPIIAHGGEFVLSADVVDAIKNGRATSGLPALSTPQGGSAASGSGLSIENAYFGDRRVVADLDVFARSRLAGV